MSARTNFVIRTTADPKQDLVLYSHWGGDTSVRDFQNAIRRAMARAGDDTYFTRILVCQLVGEDWDGETNFGLSIGEVYGEEEYEYKEINLVNGTVTIGSMVLTIDQFLEHRKQPLSIIERSK